MLDFVSIVILAVGILQVPILMDVLDNTFPHLGIGRITRWGLGKFLFALLFGVCVAALGIFFATFLPFHVEHPFASVAGWAHIVFAVWLWINTVVHYYFASTISPGVAPPLDPSDPANSALSLCSKCSAEKKPLVHHCHICDVCVVAMDHHCPFTMNCVGLRNFFHFFMFLVYGTSGLLYASVMSFSAFVECWIEDDMCRLSGSISIIFVTAFVFFLSCLGLLLFHVILLLTNMTTVDCLVTLRTASLQQLFSIMATSHRAPSSKLHTLLLVGRPWWHFLVPLRWSTHPKSS